MITQDQIDMTKMTKTAALRQARAEHSQVFRCVPGPTGYGYSVWSEQHNAMWAATPIGTYNTARGYRSRSIYERAAELMFGPDEFGERSYAIADESRSAREQFDRLCQTEEQSQ